MKETVKVRLFLALLMTASVLTAAADEYGSLWKKAGKAQRDRDTERACEYIDKVFDLALKTDNPIELTRALYAYDALGARLGAVHADAAADRVWEARLAERNPVQHVLYTHMLGRLTENDDLLRLSVADTAFLKAQNARHLLPLTKGFNLFEVFDAYLSENRPQRPSDAPLRGEGTAPKESENKSADSSHKSADRKNYPIGEEKPPYTTGQTLPKEAPAEPVVPPTLKQDWEAAALSGNYTACVFSVPGGVSRISLFESETGNPVKQWRLHRSDGRGQEQNFTADGNGNVWQRPQQIHDYDGLYDWSLQPCLAAEGKANTLKAIHFHQGNGWGTVATADPAHLRVEVQRHDAAQGSYSVLVRAPHRNITLLRDITAGGLLVEQRQYQFSDFIHFNLQWRDSYGEEALATFAYVLKGKLYVAQLRIARPK